MAAYELYKFLHVIGVVSLVGNVTVTSVWKVFADRTGDPATIGFAQRLVTGTDWAFTGGGFTLVIVGGYGMAFAAGMPLFGAGWMLWSQVMFVLSGALWAAVLLPIQVRQARLVRRHAADVAAAGKAGGAPGALPREYAALCRRWIVWGVLATLPLGAALYMMLAKVPR